jgi:predicted O-methyltransferase YrrM
VIEEPPNIGPFNVNRVSDVLWFRAVEDSADYAEEFMRDTLIFHDESKASMYYYALRNLRLKGLVAEFGVFEGYSINLVAKKLSNQTIYGFDSFEGLPEDWTGASLSKGTFGRDGVMPEVLPNVTLIKGLFNETVEPWLKFQKDPFSLLIIDCDTYDSAKSVLVPAAENHIKKGTLILFDEYFGYPRWRNHEFKIWKEIVSKHKIKYRYLALNHLQVLVEVLSIGETNEDI